MSRVNNQQLLRTPLGLLGCGFGAGLSPYAPGTVGTLVAIGPYLYLQHLPIAAYLGVLTLALALGVWAGESVIRQVGSEDPSAFVWDEFVGFWITMIAAPPGWWWIALGFVMFRLFDILKPWPVKWADRELKGGIGAMADDVLAGIYAALGVYLTVFLFGVYF